MAEEWFYALNGQQFGPVDLPVLQHLVADRQLQPSDLVWKQGMPNWVQAQTIPAIFSPPPQSPTPQAPMPQAPIPQAGYPPQSPPQQPYQASGGYPPAGYGAPAPYGQPVYSGGLGRAKAALIFGIIGIFFPFVFPLFAIVFGISGLVRMSTRNDHRGKGMAVAGLVLGFVDFFLVRGGFFWGPRFHYHYFHW